MPHIGLVFGVKPQQGCAYVEYELRALLSERSELGEERFAQLQPGTWIAFEDPQDEHIGTFAVLVPSGNHPDEPSMPSISQNRPTAWH